MSDKIQILDSLEIVKEVEKAQIDTQIATAKAYPRNIQRAIDKSISIVTRNMAAAETCGYSLRFRGGKEIIGKSVYLARILAQNWGNLAVARRMDGANATHVFSTGVCVDLETNYRSQVQAQKPITYKEGGRYSNDMIAVTGMAAASIAERNAILEVIPQSVSDEVYEAAQQMIHKQLSNENVLIKKREQLLTAFKDEYGIDEKFVFEKYKVKTATGLDVEKVKDMISIYNALKDQAANIDEIFQTGQSEESKTNEATKIMEGDNKKSEDKKGTKPEGESFMSNPE